eukprot:SAG11_NODE_11731_length_741_cov_1.767913_1_plen_41_part_10
MVGGRKKSSTPTNLEKADDLFNRALATGGRRPSTAPDGRKK